MQRIDKDKVNTMIHDSKENLTQTSGTDNAKTVLDDTDTAKSAYIGDDGFAKVTMKVAHVVKCQSVEGADKLLQFTLDVGEDAYSQCI